MLELADHRVETAGNRRPDLAKRPAFAPRSFQGFREPCTLRAPCMTGLRRQLEANDRLLQTLSRRLESCHENPALRECVRIAGSMARAYASLCPSVNHRRRQQDARGGPRSYHECPLTEVVDGAGSWRHVRGDFRPSASSLDRRSGRQGWFHSDERQRVFPLVPRAPSANGKRDSSPRHGRGRGREVRPSRHAHGRRGYRDGAVCELPQIRSAASRLARSRPLRAVGRAWVDASLFPPPPHRLSGDDDRGAASVPSARQPNGRPSRIRVGARHRDDDGPSRPRSRERGGHGPGRTAVERPLRRRPRRSLYLCDRRGWLPHGGDQPRGDLAGGAPPARKADRPLGRQPRLNRWLDRPCRCRRSARPIPRLRLGRAGGRRHQPGEIYGALARAKATKLPSFIACRTTIGYGAPTKAGTAAAHGAPLGVKEIEGARAALGWPYPPFEVPEEIVAAWRQVGLRGTDEYRRWRSALEVREPAVRAEFARLVAGRLPENWQAPALAVKRHFAEKKPRLATRQTSKATLDALVAAIPEMVGGSADLTGSNGTLADGMATVSRDNFAGRYIHYGVREHAMAAVMNGMALHKGVIPYGGTFLIFTDYCRPAIRLAALMHQRVVFVMTHDSIGLGEDGPTHQPVEQLAGLRAIPNLNVFRPADGVETVECWMLALESEATPSVLSLTRQALPTLRANPGDANLCAKGAYVLAPSAGERRVS